ncbi:MAG: nicotinate (nicotinamide) nucleotide adenylyltransferase [Ruminococcaceae bacterium]|nr:nicotinate (nicotinamide) nucleotide adenylyltransferase [Oscillospiraceae bacterium]
MRRLGIYGGSFSPPHLGHLYAARHFYDEAKLDALLVMPAGKPPHKALDGGAMDHDRMEMTRLLFSKENEQDRNISVSDYEYLQAGASYTYLTLKHFASPDTELYFLCGSDMFLSLETWKNPDIIFSLATIFCCSRKEDDRNILLSKKAYYEKNYGARIIVSRAPAFPISSSELREHLSMDASVSDYLSKEVLDYIQKHKLYGCGDNLPALRRFVKNKLSAARFCHILGVEKECFYLGSICKLNQEELLSLRRAALLHDITHEMSVQDQIALMQSYGVSPAPNAAVHPSVLHQYSGAAYVENEFDFSPAVSRAIACHTTGSEDMSLSDRILCLSDYIEEGRLYPDCADLRKRVHNTITPENAEAIIEEAMLIYFERTLSHLRNKGCEIHPQTLYSYRKLLENTLVKTRIL